MSTLPTGQLLDIPHLVDLLREGASLTRDLVDLNYLNPELGDILIAQYEDAADAVLSHIPRPAITITTQEA